MHTKRALGSLLATFFQHNNHNHSYQQQQQQQHRQHHMHLEINHSDIDEEITDHASQIIDRASQIVDMVGMDPNSPVKSSSEMDDFDLIRAAMTGTVKSSTEMDDLIRASLSTVTRLHRLTSLGKDHTLSTHVNRTLSIHLAAHTLS